MSFDLDRYYTPADVARRVIEKASFSMVPSSCADSTCGTGRLLEAANAVFGSIQSIGLDRDRLAIESLKRRNPNWILSVGDLLQDSSYRRTSAVTKAADTDLLVLNPPFSHGGRKSVDINYLGKTLKASVAMAHVLRSVEVFRPRQGALIIAPESLLYSETDAAARRALEEKYSFQEITELQSSTFRGARAHATVVQLMPGARRNAGALDSSTKQELTVDILRGGVPVHLMCEAQVGVPYVHTTHLRRLVQGQGRESFVLTSSTGKGRVEGWAVLLPRVGMPERELVVALDILTPIQLSDCVIALGCRSRNVAVEVADRVHGAWHGFVDLYRGTGARYVTVARLTQWLASQGIRSAA